MDILKTVEELKQKIIDRSKPKTKAAPAGDRGQRYAIWARRNGKGELLCLGWCESADGGVIGQAARIHSEWSDMRVVDRDPNGKRGRFIQRVTCRKCREEFDAGGDHCRYCNNSFVPAIVGNGPDETVIRCGYCDLKLAQLADEHSCAQGVEAQDVKTATAAAVTDKARGVSNGGLSQKTST